MTKWQLMKAFLNRTPIKIHLVQFSVINKIEHEDGSGCSFNVTGLMANTGIEETVYIRTIEHQRAECAGTSQEITMRTFIVCIHVPEADHYDSIEVMASSFTEAIESAKGMVPEGTQCLGIVDQRWIEQTNLNLAALTSESERCSKPRKLAKQ